MYRKDETYMFFFFVFFQDENIQMFLLICIESYSGLTHWGQVMHLCISKLTIIGSDNDLLPGRCQAIV